MASAQFVELLRTLQSHDNTARSAAEKAYTDAKTSNPSSTLVSLVGCLNVTVCGEEHLRTQAATLFRRAVVHIGPGESAWSKVDAGTRSQIKLALLQSLEAEPISKVRKIIVSAIAAAAGDTSEQPWTDLVQNAFALANSANAAHQESSLQLLEELFDDPRYVQLMLAAQTQLGALISKGLTEPSLQNAAVGLVTTMVASPSLDDASQNMLQPVLPMLEQALQGMANTNAAGLETTLQQLVECAMERAIFFKPRYSEWVDLMLTVAKARGAIEDGCRSLCLEWVASIAESKPKALSKVVPDLFQKVLSVAFEFMTEVQDNEGWCDVDEDEEEDDDDSLAKSGEARIDFFVKKYTFAQAGKVLMGLLQQYSSSGQWQGKFATAMAIRASVEFVDNASVLDNMVAMLLSMAKDTNMRVRYAVLLALGQMCHDQEADFHNRWHAQLIPVLVDSIGDSIDRCAAMGVGALEAVVADLDDTVLSQYAEGILTAAVAKLTTTSHRGVIICVMELVGAVAAGLEGNFHAYYDKLMTVLLGFVSRQDVQPSAVRIRGKAFECISLLGYSVGKEKFATAAPQAMSAMLATPQFTDVVETECVRGAMERMCGVMGPDFAAFLPTLLPGILSSMKLEEVVNVAPDDAEDTLDEIIIPVDNKFFKVKTSQMTDILATVNLLTTFIKETGALFLDYVQPTVEALDGILMCSDPVLRVACDIRDAVYPCWAALVEIVTKSVATKGQESQTLAVQLVQRFVDKVAADLVKAEEPNDIAPMATGVAQVVRNAGAGCLQPAQAQCVCDLALSEIMKSFQREKALTDANSALQVGATLDEDDDEDIGDLLEKGEEDEEKDCRLGLCSIFGACMKANPDVFVAHSWPRLQPMLQEWLGPQGGIGRPVGLHLASEICEHLRENAVTVWPVFMDQVLASIGEGDADSRNTAAFTVMLAARVPAFGAQYGNVAYTSVTNALQKFKAKKSDEEAQRAIDNAVAALVQLMLVHPSACSNLDSCWQLAFTKLPFKVDFEEGQNIHRRLFTEAQKMSGGSLGSMARVAQVLGYLCEIYGRSEQCDDDLQHDIANAFASLPQETLQSLLGQFSAKQHQKAQRILQDGRQ